MTPSSALPVQPPDSLSDSSLEQAVPEQTVSEQVPVDIAWPPNDLESDEPPFETVLHLRQMMLLLNCLHWIWRDRNDYFAAGNLTVYYRWPKRKSEDLHGPDFFVALNTQPHPRKSWMVWEEDGKYPDLIVELLSDSTAEIDRTVKKRLYAETFRTPEYFWFDPDGQEFAGFSLVRGQYEPIEPTEQGWLWSEQLQMYLGVYEQRLRFFEADGQLVPTPDEAAIAAQQSAIAAQQSAIAFQQSAIAAEQNAAAAEQNAIAAEQNAAAAEQRATQLANKLRELGVDPDTL